MNTIHTRPGSAHGEVAALEAEIIAIAAHILREPSWPDTLPADERHLIAEVLRVAALLWVRAVPGVQ